MMVIVMAWYWEWDTWMIEQDQLWLCKEPLSAQSRMHIPTTSLEKTHKAREDIIHIYANTKKYIDKYNVYSPRGPSVYSTSGTHTTHDPGCGDWPLES